MDTTLRICKISCLGDPISHTAIQWEQPRAANVDSYLPDHLRREIRKPLSGGINPEKSITSPNQRLVSIHLYYDFRVAKQFDNVYFTHAVK